MKAILKRFFVGVFIIALSGVAFWVMRSGAFSPHQPLNATAAAKAFDPHLSVLLAQQQKQKVLSKISPSVPAAHHRVSAPLDHLSEEEERSFPGGIVVEATEIEGPEADQKIRLRILKTHFKYPFIRTEELIDQQGVITRAEMVADHFLVTLPPGATPEAFLKKMGLQASLITRVTPDASLYRVDLNSSSLSTLPHGLEKGAEVPGAICEPDFIAHSYLVPNNPFYKTNQWGLWPSFYYRSQIFPFAEHLFDAGSDAEHAWDVQTSAASIVVAVVDSGIRYTHENLVGNIWQNPAPTDDDKRGCVTDHDGNLICCGFNAYGDGSLDRNGNHIPSGNPMDLEGHGTYVAGIIGATGNSGVGIAGVAWKVQLMACRHSDENGNIAVSDSISCIDYAIEHKARIINCSWGTGDVYSQDLYKAMQRAQQAGVIVVAAAGNEGKNLDEIPDYPSSFVHDFKIPNAASKEPQEKLMKGLDNIIVVTASTMANEIVPALSPETSIANFSSPYGVDYGPNTVHLAAPGWNIYGPYVHEPGQQVNEFSDAGYANGGGTSAAAPFVTGTLALLAELYRMDSYQALIGRLLTSVDKNPAYEGNVITGGKLNIYKALTQVYTPLSPSVKEQ
ncbi:MAG: hypothetical protein FJ390_01235 [Verrucomicrobia bacterium]|nr:hypothetical protein [Verrucomicrobiota bacterium]